MQFRTQTNLDDAMAYHAALQQSSILQCTSDRKMYMSARATGILHGTTPELPQSIPQTPHKDPWIQMLYDRVNEVFAAAGADTSMLFRKRRAARCTRQMP